MQAFDLAIIAYFQTLTHRSEAFDAFVVFIANTNLIKGGIVMALFWWAWFMEDEKRPDKREYLLFGFGMTLFSVVVARILALSLPFRDRPLHNPALHFQIPYTMNTDVLLGWSSFPSDHAVVFTCLAITLWMVSRPLGIAAALHAIFVVSLPRIYVGIHYPTDVIAGMVVGCVMGSVVTIDRLRNWIARIPLRWSEQYAGPFYAFFFLCTFELSEMFDTVRVMAHPFTLLIKPFLTGPH